MTEDRQRRVAESVAGRFSRLMNATCSPIGALTDPALLAAASAFTVVAALGLYARFEPEPTWPLYLLAASPVLIGTATSLALSGARKRVIAWLASVPFPIDNMNGLLNGVGHTLAVRFVAAHPDRSEINEHVEQVHDDCFALEYVQDEPEIEVRVGVPESKLNPAAANHRRYVRVRRLVDEALVPLSERYPIERVRIS